MNLYQQLLEVHERLDGTRREERRAEQAEVPLAGRRDLLQLRLQLGGRDTDHRFEGARYVEASAQADDVRA